jgi:serine/threonine protein phosphatase PrpC
MISGFRIVAATGIDLGDREYQQDQLLLTSHPRVKSCVLGVVADGMGGRSGGRKASDQVMLTAQQLLDRYDPGSDDPCDFLERIAREAHIVIRLTAVSSEEEPHSTIAAFVINPDGTSAFAHSGDSRLYHFRADVLQHCSKDHSFVQTLVDRGELTEEQALHDTRSNLLMHCLGAESEPVVTRHPIGQLQPGDTLLACSDGLWHYFSAVELGRVVSQLSPRQSCEFLTHKARQRAEGRGDNLSLIIVKLEPLAVPPKTETLPPENLPTVPTQVSEVSTSRRSWARYLFDCISLSRETVRGNSCDKGPSV